MKLTDWMTSRALSPDDLAKQIGVTAEAVRRYRTGSRMPEPLIAEKIVEVTKGKVTVQDLHDARMAFLRGEVSEAA